MRGLAVLILGQGISNPPVNRSFPGSEECRVSKPDLQLVILYLLDSTLKCNRMFKDYLKRCHEIKPFSWK
jgi:hypothetical protein